MLTLRPYQSALVDEARAALRAGCRRLLLQSSTGSGKTVLVAHLLASAAAKGKRAWFVVHRRELVDQSVQTFVSAAGIHTGIVAAGYPLDPAAPVQVCSVGSLMRRRARLPVPDLIVFDECHHTPSSSWSAIAAAVPSAHTLGLTATPQRLDGRGLGAYFDRILCGPSTADLIRDGYLSPYRYYAPGAGIETAGVHRVAGDYSRREVAGVMAQSTVTGDAVAHYQQHAAGGRALVFVWSLDASRALAEAFRAAGVLAAHVDGETPRDERRAAMAAFRAGDLRVVCNVDLFGEGLDVPAVDAVFLLRPTASLGLFLQQCGRGLRVAEGKPVVRIFDHVGNWGRHGLPDDPRAWTLDAARKSETVPTARRCRACFAVSPAGALVCVACGLPFPAGKKPRVVAQVDGSLTELSPAAVRQQTFAEAREARSLAELHDIAKRAGYAPGWAWHRWLMSPHNPATGGRSSRYGRPSAF